MNQTSLWQLQAAIAGVGIRARRLLVRSQSIQISQLQAQLQQHLCSKGLGASEINLSFLAHGEANVIFRLNGDQLVRVAVNTPNQRFGGEPSRVTQLEAAVLAYLEGSEIGHQLYRGQLTPPADFPYTYLLTNYLEGSPLDYSRTHLQQCAQTLAALHRLPQQADPVAALTPKVPVVDQPLACFYQESLDYAQPYLDSPAAEPDIVAALRSLLERSRQRLSQADRLQAAPYCCLVHSDHTYENWVINAERAYLIDWEWAELGSPAGDLGHFLSPLTVRRCGGYQLPAADRAFFLQTYYAALGPELAAIAAEHFAVFGPLPAVRSLCWTAGYWVSGPRWYAEAAAESASAADRLARIKASYQQFLNDWQAVMTWLEEPI